jgi:hypothetical protein
MQSFGRKVWPQKLEELIRESEGLSMDAVSHEVCLVGRMQLDDVHSQPVVARTTDFIKSRLAK